jgi:hypothetical protein
VAGFLLANLLCVQLSGCAFFETIAEILSMVIMGLIILIQSLIPIAAKLAPLLLVEGPDGEPVLIQMEPGTSPEEAARAVARLMEQNAGSVMAAEVHVVPAGEVKERLAALAREADAPGMHVSAALVRCEGGERGRKLARRLKLLLAREGVRLRVYRPEEFAAAAGRE